MVRIAFVFIVILITSCSSSDEPIDTSLPSCIEEILANPELSEDIKTIQVQRLDNESHYWLNNDIRFVDGIEYIILLLVRIRGMASGAAIQLLLILFKEYFWL